jgi:hypothetical protein
VFSSNPETPTGPLLLNFESLYLGVAQKLEIHLSMMFPAKIYLHG